MKPILSILLVFSVFSVFGQSGAEWNAYKRANGIDPRWTYNAWVAAGMPRNNGGGNGGYSGPSPEQIAEQQREQAARQQDKQGLDAYNQGDYDTAIDDFQKALQTLPNDANIQQHLTDAQQAQADAKKAKEKAAADKAAHDAEVARQFQQTKTEVLGEMKGISSGLSSDGNDTGLKGIGDDADASGLKGIDDDTTRSGNAITANDSSGLKTLSDVNTDPMVVDMRNVPTGLPKEVEDSIPHTPAGDRVRKGFEAIQDHDWKVALAWFQDALNDEPNDPGLKRLVDLAQYTLQRENQTAPVAVAKPSGNDAVDIKQALGDYNSYLSNANMQRAIKNNTDYTTSKSDEEWLNEGKEDPAWTKFFDTITSWIPTPKQPAPDIKRPAAIGVRG